MVVVLLSAAMAAAENIDPDDNAAQYAWAENVGWMNAEPLGEGGPGVQAGDSELSGWIWAENVGWISLSCKNTLSCSTTDYGVLNDGHGNLSGFAWAENIGWIRFSTSSSGVTIDPATGEFSGFAWSENTGWISFNCANTASCGDVDYKVKTAWMCSPLPPAPTGAPDLQLGTFDTNGLLTWDLIGGATGADVVDGSLSCLRNTGGDFSSCTSGCRDDDRTAASLLHVEVPAPGDGLWFLVRGQNCGGNGSYDIGQSSQIGLRDGEIVASGNDCP